MINKSSVILLVLRRKSLRNLYRILNFFEENYVIIMIFRFNWFENNLVATQENLKYRTENLNLR